MNFVIGFFLPIAAILLVVLSILILFLPIFIGAMFQVEMSYWWGVANFAWISVIFGIFHAWRSST